MTSRVPRTRNAGTWTEAQYWGRIRSVLRNGFRYWKPMTNCRNEAKRAYKGKRKGQKWEYQCNHCSKWFKGTEVQIDHIEPVGSLKNLEDLPGFVERLTAEEGYQLLCKDCHQKKTTRERNERKNL